MPLKPSQCRAGRALLRWSQDELQEKSGVSKKTIADFEREEQIPYDRTLREIELALEAGGVALIPENGGGAGVRLKAAVPVLSRKRISVSQHQVVIAINYRAREFQLQFSTDVLNDLDETNHRTIEAFEKSLDTHMNLVLLTAAAAIDSNRTNQDGVVDLKPDDFEDAGRPLRRAKRFVVGQRYVSKRPPHKYIEIVQVADDGRRAWVDRRTKEGALVESTWVILGPFLQNWTLI